MLVSFGLGFTVNRAVLSPTVVKGIIRDVDFAEVARSTMEQSTSSPNLALLSLQNSLVDGIDRIQPLVKEKLYVAIDDAYSYLLGDNTTVSLKAILGDSFMNADFLEKLLAEIDLANLAEETLNDPVFGNNGDTWGILEQAFLSTISTIEPELKAQVVKTSRPVFQYLLGQTNSLDLIANARNTFLSNTFTSAIIDSIDLKPVTKNILEEQLGPLPDGVTLTEHQLSSIAVILEPVVKSELKTVIGPISDYFLGESPGFNVIVSFNMALPQFQPIVKEAFIASAPAALIDATPAEIDAAADAYWEIAVDSLPVGIALDTVLLDPDIEAVIIQMFTNLQDGLDQTRLTIEDETRAAEDQLSLTRTDIIYFRWAFYGLICLILVVIGGISLIQRSLNDVCRGLGITLTIYGALSFAAVMLLRLSVPVAIIQHITDIPQYFTDLLPGLVQRLTGPLFSISLVFLLIGIALIVISFVYPKMKGKQAEVTAEPAVTPLPPAAV